MLLPTTHVPSPSRRANLIALCALAAILCGVVSTARAADITSNLVVYYKLDETSGTVGIDSAPGAQNGTHTSDCSAATVAGKFGNGMNYPASAFHTNLNAATIATLYGTSAMTLAAWVNPNVTTGANGVIVELNANSTVACIRLTNNQMDMSSRSIGGGSFKGDFTEGPIIPQGSWSHLCCVFTYGTGTGTMTSYVNGTLVATHTGLAYNNATFTNSGTTLNGAIGARVVTPGAAGDTQYSAQVDEVRIYARALTQADIQGLLSLKSTWSGAAGVPNWSNAANWDNIPVSNSGGSMAFPGAAQINANNDISTPFQVNVLTHSNTFAGTNVISSTAGNVLQFSGPGATLTQSGSAALNMSCPIDFQSAAAVANTGGPLTLSGPLSDSGAVTLTGTGTDIVNNAGAASTNSGLITVSGPTLEVDGAMGTAGVTMTAGTLRGTAATIGGTVSASGGTISPGVPGSPSSLVSTMTMGGLALSGNGAITFDLNDIPGGPNNDTIVVNGAFASGGSVNFNFGPGFTGQTFPQTYTLITTASPPTGPTPLIGTITGGAFHVNNIAFVGNSLQVTFGAGASVTATWSTNTTPANWNTAGNWAAGVVPAPGVATTLIFPTLGGFVSTYTSNNDIPTTPYVLNLLTLSNNNNGNAITGNAIQFDGGAPAIQQNGTGSFSIQTPVSLNAGLNILGGGSGAVALAGQISGSGGITNANPSVALTLSNPTGNLYTGNTAINGGSLVVSNTGGSATGVGSVTLAANTSLSGTGSISGAVTLNGATTLSPGVGAGTIGTLATGSLTLNNNSTVNLDLAAPGTNDQITITGNGTFAGTLNVTNSGGAMAPGSYTLFTYTGTPTDLGFSLLAPSAFGYQLSTTGGAVKLTALAAGGISTWAATGTANFAKPSDWDIMPGNSATTTLSFPTLASAYVANNNITGLSVNSIALSSIGNSISGNSIGLQGTTPSITQSALGNFTINTPIVLNANTTITPAAGATVTLSGAISGTGGLNVAGAGAGTPATVTITGGANTFTGATTVTNNALLLLQNTTGTPGIATNGVLGATSSINITGAEVRVNPTAAVTNFDRPITFNNGALLNIVTGATANLNPAGAWTLNANTTPAMVRYATSNAYGSYFGIPVLTDIAPTPSTLRLEMNNGVSGATGLGGIFDFGPGAASTINCKVVVAGVNGGNSSAVETNFNNCHIYLNNGPYLQGGTSSGLYFENAVQMQAGNGSRVINTNLIIQPGTGPSNLGSPTTVSFQGRHTGTTLDAGTHDLILHPGPAGTPRTLTIMSGAALNLDMDFRGNSQGDNGGVLQMMNTVIQNNATLTYLRSNGIPPGTPTPAAAPFTIQGDRSMIVGCNITGSGPASAIVINLDTHDGGYNTINSIVTSGTTATVTTDNPHGFNVNDWVAITHNETEAGAGANPAPALPAVATGGANPLAGDFQVTSVTSPTSFTYNCTAAAATLSAFTVKPVVGPVGVGFANSVMPVGTANQVCNLIVNGGLVIQTGTNAVSGQQGSAQRISNLLTSARLAALTGTGGFLAPKPTDTALTIPNGWAITVPVKLLVSHNVSTGADIRLGGAFNNDIVVGGITGGVPDSQATLDGNGQTIGGTLRGYGILTNTLLVGSGANVWPGSTTLTATPLAGDETLSLTGNATTGVDFSAGGKFKTILTVSSPVGGTVNKQVLVIGGGATVTLGGTSVLSLGIGAGNYNGAAIPVIQGFSPNIAAPFGSVSPSPLPAGWSISYQASGVDIGTPSPANLADSVVVLTSAAAVTPVTLGAFAAEASGAGVLVSWDATSEYKNAGFNLYRRCSVERRPRSVLPGSGTEQELRSTWTRVNPTLIAGRISNPDPKSYAFYDWPLPGVYEYRLESISLQGAKESYAELAGPVCVDAPASISGDSLDAVFSSVAILDNARQTSAMSAKFSQSRDTSRDRKGAGDAEPAAVSSGLAFDSQGKLLHPAAVTSRNAASLAPRDLSVADTSVPASPRLRVPMSPSPSPSLVAALRAFTTARPGASYTAAKIVYDTAGVLRVPQASLPAGFNINRVAIQREGRAMTALAVTPDSLILYGPGYADDYTDKDALFLRATSGATSAGTVTHASGLFTSNEAVNTNTPATVVQQFHDVYFDFALRPYDYPPWFSSQYLTGGSDQNFTLNAPDASGGPASLTVAVWSLTTTDHALQLLVNGQPAGQAQWSGGDKMVQLTFELDAGLLAAGANSIDLVTPALAGVDASAGGTGTGQIAFVNSMTLSYTRSLLSGTGTAGGAGPLTVLNRSVRTQLCEVANLASPDVWVVDTRYPDRAALVPYETQAQADGTYRLRFHAAPGGTGQFLVVPSGQENAPLSVTKRSVKPVRIGGTYLATGPAQFAAGVQPLLMKHAKEGLRGAFVDQEQLFDYYNYGRYGPSAIQNAVRSVRPQYLLLLGRTTYDYRNYSGLGVDPLCPTFLVSTTFWSQATSDSMFGDLGRGYPEVAVGRLPVNTAAELSGAVNHIVSYAGAPASGVRAHIVADRLDPATADFGAQADAVAAANPDLSWQKNYLGTTFQTSPEVTAAMRDAANGGADWVFYIGHGNSVRLGKDDPRILQTDDVKDNVKDWTGNVVFIQGTCTANWMAKDVAGFKSIAMEALTQPQGGISASIGTSTYMNSDYAVEFTNQLLQRASKNGTRWGNALMLAQQWAYQKSGGGAASFYGDLNRTEQIFGDPAMPVFARDPKAQAGMPTGAF